MEASLLNGHAANWHKQLSTPGIISLEKVEDSHIL